MNELKRTELQCMNCKTWFPSPIQFGSQQAFEASTLKGNLFGCPACGRMVPCNQENMRWSRSDGKGGFVGIDISS